MTVKPKEAPYGRWKSRISVEHATMGNRELKHPRACPRSKRFFCLSAKRNGSNQICELVPQGPFRELKLLAPSHNCDSLIYEYGGLPYALVAADEDGGGHGLRIVFSDTQDQSCKLLDVDSGDVRTLIKSATLRFGDFDPHPTPGSPWVLCQEEDHGGVEAGEEVRNYVSVIDIHSGAVRRLATGADFYSYPRFSPDGAKVCWREWDHPNLPFLSVRLRWADFCEDAEGGGGGGGAELRGVETVAGDGGQSVAELRWAPDGTLFYTQELEGMDYRQLCTVRPGQDVSTAQRERYFKLDGLEEVEFGDASWYYGCQTFVFLSETAMIASYTKFGTSHLVHVDIPSRKWTPLDINLHELRFDPLAPVDASTFIVRGSGHTEPSALYRVSLSPTLEPTSSCMYSSVMEHMPREVFSTPRHVQLTTKGAPVRPVHGFFWPPHSDGDCVAPAGTLPPLIVVSHGGPTGHTTPGLDMGGVQYWTSRGFAVFAINYTGSSGGHGRAYRERLFGGGWGVLDRDDVPEAVAYLAERGLVDGSRVGIQGGSAGGYLVLQSMVWHSAVFAGGVCHCGVSDIKGLVVGTHKLESRYMDLLLLEEGREWTAEDKEARFRDRSPLFRAERITAPLLLVHGDRDTIVPIEQSMEIRDKIRDRGGGGDVRLVVLPGEGHIFKKPQSQMLALEEELAWWEKTLLADE
ncbi:hypothetical protein RB597_000811 [Gaeumannomyces tritici]